ncbi:MAG: DegT/DnrJ/EryC1/StrS family aminotransferase [Armatimonadetes bacterium]|nr:DegT/DnrJ/EryC1/StrS family aminotransferase [Armatimonadota bacterium]
MKKFNHQIGVGGLVLSDYEKQLANEVLDSNHLTYGPMTKRFEQEFAKSHKVKHALFMNSGTSALHVALAALKDRHGWSDGDEIIVPAVTFVATANIVLHNNMTPVFVDVEPDTFNIDPQKIEEKITGRTRAIIPVHLLGLPATMQPVLEMAEKYRLEVIEDSAECMFAKYKGGSVGSMGVIGCFSTYLAHFIVTGVGGLATTNNSELAVDMRSLMNHGRDGIYLSATDDKGLNGQTLEEVVARRFSFIHVGHSMRCTELEAAIGVGQLAKSKKIIKRRQEIAATFTQGLEEFENRIQLPTCPPDRTHSFMLYGIVLKKESKRKLVNHLEHLNVETRDLLPLINQPIYKRLYGNLEDKYPVAKHINESGFYIGCHPYMNDEEVGFVIEAFKNFFQNN